MLSVTSLSAFSGGLSPIQPVPVRLPGPGSAAGSAAPSPPAPPQSVPPGNGSGPEPTHMLPRGSLLDLYV